MRSSYFVAAGALVLLGGLLWLGRPDAGLTGQSSLAARTGWSSGELRPLVPRVPPSIASLPDRGNLVAFDTTPSPRQRSAYTWHAVSLSEEHAIRAVTTGEMTVDVPDGPAVHLKYVRHVEHPDGNWTWIGRPEGTKPGIEAIITFGEKAVFGSIPYGDRPPLRVTTEAGRTWMVDTDPTLLATLDNAAVRPRGPDTVLPPVSRARHRPAAADAGALQASSAQSMPAAAAVASAANTVDVLLGYTSTFASRLGGQSQALTRLNYMVDVANQAYANSQVSAQVRLVGAMQVSYPDATKNETALYELTGVDCSGTCVETAIPASLQPLHAARDRYGADLVSLVRNFDNDTQLSCGIAWLIGGGYALSADPIEITQQDEYAGFSVVSDTNGTEDKSFPDNNAVCRDETLAHELGHNMGLAHDRTTAAGTDDSNGDGNLLDPDEYGRYPYSFGYRTNSPGNFYTVMAYREVGSSQVQNRKFSNPQLSTCGPAGQQIYPCGIADQADNARSLRATIPIIATFRSAQRDSDADFDGDGLSDVLWRSTASGANAIWHSANAATGQVLATVTDQNWKIAGIADFSGDGRADILWRHSSTGKNAIWLAGNASTPQGVATVGDGAWKVACVGDFDGDRRADIFWRNASTGANALWLAANGATSRPVAPAATSWQVVGVGDFDGDGFDDIFWRQPSTGSNAIWRSASSGAPMSVSSAATSWRVGGVGDFDADGRSDVLWRNASTGVNAIWRSGSSSQPQTVASVPDLTWSIADVADYNGDGRADIFWRNRSGANAIWRSANSATPMAVTAASSSWQVMR